ncbi:bifunctional adenosylcobinamide kinase/adenosylcobinamide-phosphate guanylyltransferase [Chromatiales bacterium (ex Bugula neritina AB1)]|nr:bifunctional adenosylcobinamide kinase/adenosylcobinamide-phosphate guanylyltransferase [Chromatiales bacterium (ex Bugula neritina AB1)]
MNTLVLGGVKSGKSSLAAGLAASSSKQAVIIATATAEDGEMRRRIARHRAERSPDWLVVEEPVAIAQVLDQQTSDTIVVVDCLTLWLTNLLLADDEQILIREREALLQSLAAVSADVVLVSNEVSMGVVPMGELSRRFCDEAGVLHQRIAALSDTVILCVAGLPHFLKVTD